MESATQLINSLLASLGLKTWVAEVFFIVFFPLLVNFIQKRILKRLGVKVQKTANPWDDALLGSIDRPLTVLIWIIGIAFAVKIIQQEQPAAILEAVWPIRDVGVIACIAWFLTRFLRRAEKNIAESMQAKGEAYDRTTLDAVGKLLRLSVIITAALVALQTLGYSVSGVLAFGGIGGLAVGFAARELLANFFGGLMVYMDRPFAVGDWVRSPDRDIEGTVEKIGWRSTVIRTFDSRPLYVPNATFTTIAVQNPSRMHNRRIYETIGVRYDDASKMVDIVSEVKQMIENHPGIDSDKTLMVNFNAFGASSLDFFIYCMTKTTVWAEYHAVKQDVLFKVFEIINHRGAEIAFPTRTIHVPEGIPVPQRMDAQAA
jgi:MscS family membrane protein